LLFGRTQGVAFGQGARGAVEPELRGTRTGSGPWAPIHARVIAGVRERAVRVIAVAWSRAQQRYFGAARRGQAGQASSTVGGNGVGGAQRSADWRVQGRGRAPGTRVVFTASSGGGAAGAVGMTGALGSGHARWGRRAAVGSDGRRVQGVSVVAQGASVARGVVVCAAELAVAAERAQQMLA